MKKKRGSVTAADPAMTAEGASEAAASEERSPGPIGFSSPPGSSRLPSAPAGDHNPEKDGLNFQGGGAGGGAASNLLSPTVIGVVDRETASSSARDRASTAGSGVIQVSSDNLSHTMTAFL